MPREFQLWARACDQYCLIYQISIQCGYNGQKTSPLTSSRKCIEWVDKDMYVITGDLRFQGLTKIQYVMKEMKLFIVLHGLHLAHLRVRVMASTSRTWKRTMKRFLIFHLELVHTATATAHLPPAKRSLRRLCFYTCLSVHRGGLPHCMLGYTPPG